MLKIKDREKNLKAAKGKQLLTNQEASISLKANFSPEMLEARMQCDTCSSIKRKELSIKDLTSTKIPFKNERKIEGWSKTVIQENSECTSSHGHSRSAATYGTESTEN